MRWMTVKSFAVLNPGWKIHVHYPTDPIADQPWMSGEQASPDGLCEDLFGRLGGFEQVTECPMRITFCNSEVQRSDLLRWKLLAEEGGVWADFDILFIKPMDAIDLPCDVDVVLSYFKTRNRTDANRIGFLMSASNDAAKDFYSCVYRAAMKSTADSAYQSLGRRILDQFIPGRESEFDAEFYNLPQPVVYPFVPRQLHRIYWTRTLELDASTIGIHWYAGHPDSQLQQAKITESNVAKQPAHFYKLMTTMLKGKT